MQLTIDSAEPLDRVLAVIAAVYDVELTASDRSAGKPQGARRSSARRDRNSTDAAATRRRGPSTRPRRRAPAGKPEPASVRAWAKANGHRVNDRGRVPAGVTAAYVAAGSPTT